MTKNKHNQRLSATQKNADKKQWYKDYADLLDNGHRKSSSRGVSEYKRKKVNYDLFNGIIDPKEFEHVCQPFGAEMGELPARMSNKDIVSGKIKSILGKEMKRSFSYAVTAINRDATTRKEQEEFGRLREYVVGSITKPIREQVELEAAEKAKGQKLNPDEIEQVKAQIEEEIKLRTPPETKRYMEREHQDPAEVLHHQLLEFLVRECDTEAKFNTALKHGLLSAESVMYVGILNGKPDALVVNALDFEVELGENSFFIEDGERASYMHRMLPSDIVKYFGKELSNADTDIIYESWSGNRTDGEEGDLFYIDETVNNYADNSTIPVLHCVWKSLRKIGFLTSIDEDGEEQETIVDEAYRFKPSAGDKNIDWEWIPEVYETWKICANKDIYVQMQPIPGQFKDLDNLYNCKLPYYGVVYDNLNSEPTAIMDRLKPFQYFYNILFYKYEMLAATDKGKKLLMNINNIPDDAGIDVKTWQYFLESTPYAWFNNGEEGDRTVDVNTVAKVIDLSYAGQMSQYVEMMEYCRLMAGRASGVPDNVEGEISQNEAVGNTQQSLAQSSNILELIFNLHDHMKRNVLTALLETAKIAYVGKKPRVLTYVLDDMSERMIDLNEDNLALLDASTVGLYVSNSAKAEEVKAFLTQLSHAAMQNDKVALSDVIKVARQEGVIEAEEILEVAENKRKQEVMDAENRKLKSQEKQTSDLIERGREEHKEEIEKILVKGKEDRKGIVLQNSLMGASFNPDLDKDKDGVNDFIEIARDGVDANIKQTKQQLEREEFEHKKEMDKKNSKQVDKKLEIEDKKASNSKKS